MLTNQLKQSVNQPEQSTTNRNRNSQTNQAKQSANINIQTKVFKINKQTNKQQQQIKNK